ncbi:MAG: hypothetical protein CL610_17775 [Anaerolineaceae bacterium]|nr:hypothetical protein [Anaerolineaceae bacterium]
MRSRLFGSAIYLFYFGAGGSLLPYLNLYYQNVGMDKQQIGVLIASTTLAAVISAPVWSALADAFRLHRHLLPLAIFGTLLPVALISQASEFATLWVLISIYAFFNGSIVPQADNAVLVMLSNDDDNNAYGKLRLWGAVGFGLSAWGGGILAEQSGMPALFVMYLFFMFMCGLIATQLPAPRETSSEPFLRNLRRLSTNYVWIGFLTAIFLVGLASSTIHNYLVLYITDMGGGEGLYGLLIAIAGVSELPVFFFSGWLLRRFKPRGLLVIAFSMYMVRTLLLSIIPSPEWAIIPQLMHGLSFSALWSASVVYVKQIAPSGLGATAQSALTVTLFGIAGVVGGLFGANIYEVAGPVALFRIVSLTSLIGLCLFVTVEFFSRRARQAELQPQ